MSLSNLSLEALKSVISTANNEDCEQLLEYVKKRRVEIDNPTRYVFIYIDSDYTWRKPYTPEIHLDVICSSSELPRKVFDKLNVYIESYDNDYRHFLDCIISCDKFTLVRGISSNGLREFAANATLIPSRDDHEVGGPDHDIFKHYFKSFGLNLFLEIHKSIGLTNFFDNFEYSCGVLCLMKLSKTLAKLIRNGLPWDK